jgi:bacillithiol biosynthesis cysteine-adding enzyme BshC
VTDTQATASGDVRAAVPFGRLPWIRPLVHAHAHDFESVATLFSGNPADPDAWRAAVRRVQARPASPGIADVLSNQLLARQAPADAVEAARALADPATVAVVTGQQAGLFGGPLYTLLKAMSAIKVARHVAGITGARTVPVFWVDSEDHDWAEIKSAHILDRDASLVSVTLDEPEGAGTQPVGRLRLGGSVEGTIAALCERLAPSEYTPSVRELLERCYRPGTRLTTAFAMLLDQLLGPLGLVVFEADDPRAKPLAASVFTRELNHPCEAASLAIRGGERMTAAGHQPQILPSDDTVSLFYLDQSGRQPIRYRDGQFRIGDEVRAAKNLQSEALSHPDRFSPNVLLRPLVQDTLFRTVAYVAGPSELAYQAQLADVYRVHEIPQPILVSRASVTLLDSAATKFLDRSSLPLEALQPRDESALNRLLEEQLPPAVDHACGELDALIQASADGLRAAASAVDPTLAGAVDTTVDRLRETVKTLQGKIVQAAKKKDDTLRRQFTRTRALVFPDGHPQERHLSTAFFLNRYGTDLPARLLKVLPALPDAHLLISP